MAKKDQKGQEIEKISKQITGLDRLARRFLISADPSFKDRQILSTKDQKFQTIINRELDISKGVAGNSIVDFIATLKDTSNTGQSNKGGATIDTNSLFTNDIGDIYGYFTDQYKNKYLELTDLKLISKFIPSLGEAVKVMLDGIVSSDDVASNRVKRTLFLPDSIPETERDTIVAELEKIEKDEKLLKRLKNTVFRKTLVSGKHYVYAIGYQELYGQYLQKKSNDELQNTRMQKLNPRANAKGFNINGKATESYGGIRESVIATATAALESSMTEANEKNVTKEIKQFTASLESHLGDFTITNSPYLNEAINECADLENAMEAYGGASFMNAGMNFNTDSGTIEATANLGGVKSTKSTKALDKITGTYLNFIDAKYVLPMKLFNQKVGYYYVHPTPRKKKTQTSSGGILTVNSALFNSTSFSESRKEQAINTIVDTISDAIMNNFSAKFASEHTEFRRLIADCIIANGIVDNDYNIQFIPAHQIIEFTINETDDGDGESMLSDSLFPAKMLLSLSVCKLLNYFNRSGSKTISYVHKGPIDNNTYNQTQRVIRMMQDGNVTFNDLLSTNMVFSKFARDSNIQVPMSKDGTRLIEFEQQDGQEIDLHTSMEEWLEKAALIGTGVPSTSMDARDDVSFSREIISGQIKLAGRVSCYQSDLEEPCTDLYRILIQNSALPEDLKTKAINSFEFRLTRPRVLSSANNSEFLGTLTQLAGSIADTFYGQNSSDENVVQKRDILIKKIICSESPYIDWGQMEDLFDQVEIEFAQKQKITPIQPPVPVTPPNDVDAGDLHGDDDFADDDDL